jgi:glycosyltransferase involved in cell wall biosynthesis
MKVALVHDWLTGMRGGERCLEIFCELFPGADLFTLVHHKGSVSPTIEGRRVQTSFLQRVPGLAKRYRFALPLMPMAIESFDLTPYDLVLSSSHCVAKGAITRPDAVHLAYMHTPMRYIWDLWPQYFPASGKIKRALALPALTRLRMWDVSSATRVDEFAANSRFIQKRIKKFYGRESRVIHPPIETAFWQAAEYVGGDAYLMVSALVPSKGIELAVEAFNASGNRLQVVGVGPLMKKLRAMAGPNIELLGWIGAQELRDRYARCRAFVHTAIEDFGMAPLEAQAVGAPVVALGIGGSLETVVPINRPWDGSVDHTASLPPTGVFYYERSLPALNDAIETFERERDRFAPEQSRAFAARFDRQHFVDGIQDWVEAALRGARGQSQRVETIHPQSSAQQDA